MAVESATQAASLAPGFRFHPTDEELVRYYLRRKVCGKPFRFDAISDIDIYKFEPWDLPGMSRLKSRDLEWYFFSVLDKKHGNGSRTNRATDKGYWKTTGKDRAVQHRSRTVGMKKTLVYHRGRAPRGERSNWVMHEYKLIDEELEKAGIVQDAFVLCRIFQKSGSGPKNGEQYGAPFVEEEWDNDELVMVPGEGAAEELVFDDDAFLDGNDLEQILVVDIPSEDAPLPLDHYGNDKNHAEESTEFIDDQKPLVDMGEHHNGVEQLEDQNLFNFPAQYYTERKAVKHEYIGESSNTVNPEHTDYLLDEEFLDAIHNPQFDGAFLETDDLSNPIEANAPGFDMLEEYLTFFDADDDNSQYLKMMGSETFVSDQALLSQEHVNEGTHQVATGILDECNNDAESSSKQEPSESKSDMQYPFIRRASCMLGSIPAPPALAAELPTKDVALQLNSALQPSSSIHVTAGIVHIRNVTPSGNGTEWSFSKHGNVNIVLSLDLPMGNLNSTSLLSGKDLPAISRGWFYLAFIWVLMILSMSFKIGTYIYTGKAS